MSKIRAFIAIQLPADVRQALAQTVDVLDGQTPDRAVRWVKPDLMHITLRFLGDTDEAALPSLYETLDNLGRQHKWLEFQLHKLGCFPNPKRPRVIWAGLRGDLGAASAIKKDLDDALQGLGWQPENRPFRAHITIGRVKNSGQLKNIDWDMELEKINMPVGELHLIESQLTAQGPIYTVRHTSKLDPQQ